MPGSLFANTSTLIVSLPDSFELPLPNRKIRMQKNIIKATIRLLQDRNVTPLYVGWKPSDAMSYFDSDAGSSQTIIAVNVIDSSGKICDFNASPRASLRNFRLELLYNSEHILIDNTITVDGKAKRLIEIYTASRHRPKRLEYTGNIFSSGRYQSIA